MSVDAFITFYFKKKNIKSLGRCGHVIMLVSMLLNCTFVTINLYSKGSDDEFESLFLVYLTFVFKYTETNSSASSLRFFSVFCSYDPPQIPPGQIQ